MKTPAYKVIPPSVDGLQVFRCEAWIHQQKTQHKHFGAHAVCCVFVGYYPDNPGWPFLPQEGAQIRQRGIRREHLPWQTQGELNFLFDFSPTRTTLSEPVTSALLLPESLSSLPAPYAVNKTNGCLG